MPAIRIGWFTERQVEALYRALEAMRAGEEPPTADADVLDVVYAIMRDIYDDIHGPAEER